MANKQGLLPAFQAFSARAFLASRILDQKFIVFDCLGQKLGEAHNLLGLGFLLTKEWMPTISTFAQGHPRSPFWCFPHSIHFALRQFLVSRPQKKCGSYKYLPVFNFFLSRRKDPINLIVQSFEKRPKNIFWSSTGRFISLLWGVYDPNKWMSSPQILSKWKAAFAGQTIVKSFTGQKFLVSKKFSDKTLCRVNSLCDWFKILAKKLAHNHFPPVKLVSCTQK